MSRRSRRRSKRSARYLVLAELTRRPRRTDLGWRVICAERDHFYITIGQKMEDAVAKVIRAMNDAVPK